jgi:hypothetical protein
LRRVICLRRDRARVASLRGHCTASIARQIAFARAITECCQILLDVVRLQTAYYSLRPEACMKKTANAEGMRAELPSPGSQSWNTRPGSRVHVP